MPIAGHFFFQDTARVIAVKDSISIKDMLSIGLSVLFPTLIGIFGPLVGLILVAFILGAITGGWLIRKYDSAAR